MKNKVLVLLSLMVVFWGAFGAASENQAATGAGQVTVEGGITFYEESTAPSTSSSSSTTGSLPSTGGKLPQTGEVIRNYGIAGAGVLILLLLFLFYRRKKGREEQR